MFNYLKSGFILLLFLFPVASVQAAGGIALGATRVIYPADAKQTSLSISNSDTKERYWSIHGLRIAQVLKKNRLWLHLRCLSASPKAKTRCVLSMQVFRCPKIVSRCSG